MQEVFLVVTICFARGSEFTSNFRKNSVSLCLAQRLANICTCGNFFGFPLLKLEIINCIDAKECRKIEFLENIWHLYYTYAYEMVLLDSVYFARLSLTTFFFIFESGDYATPLAYPLAHLRL